MQLIIGVICMVMIANYQYGWTPFVGPIDAKYHRGRASIQVAFTIFVILETWLVPVEGYLVDRLVPVGWWWWRSAVRDRLGDQLVG
jgi:OFA family oxalate/formate antiporter-like MFS transporter